LVPAAWDPPPLGNWKARLTSAERAPTPAFFRPRGGCLRAWGVNTKTETNNQYRTPNVELRSGFSGGDPAAQTGAGFGHRRRSLTLDVQGTLSLTQPAGGVASPTKNENWEYFHASWVPAPGRGFNMLRDPSKKVYNSAKN